MLTCVYGPQEDILKRDFLRELCNVSALTELPWIVLGDFNLHRSSDDTTGGSTNLGLSMEFNRVINTHNLMEVPLIGRKFTWSNKRPNPTFSKLDRTFLSSHWEGMGVTYGLTNLPALTSDHISLRLIIKPQGNSPKRKLNSKIHGYYTMTCAKWSLMLGVRLMIMDCTLRLLSKKILRYRRQFESGQRKNLETRKPF